MNTPALVADTEAHLRQVADELTAPHERECLLCYVYRMLEHGCVGLRWVQHYRDLTAPRATAVELRLCRLGGYCDCEIFMNAYEPAPEHWTPERVVLQSGVAYVTAPAPPESMPPCLGVRRGSTRGCPLWTRHAYGPW